MADNKTELPLQIVAGLGVTVTIGFGCTVTTCDEVAVQPSNVVTVRIAVKFIGALLLFVY